MACLAFPAQFTAAGEPLAQIGSIPLKGVEGRLDHLTFDTRSQRLFVAALENHTVEVVDLAKRRRVHQITGISEPQGLLCIPEKNRLLVCSRGDGTCRSFDATTFQEGPWIDLGRNADNLRFDPDAQTIYVGSAGEPGNGLLSAIDLVSLLPAAQGGQPAPPHSPADFLLNRPRQADPRMEIQLPAHPESFQLDRANRRLLVNIPDEHQIAVLQIGTNALTNAAAWPVTVGEKNFPMALDPASARLFIACRKPPLLAVYDSRAGASSPKPRASVTPTTCSTTRSSSACTSSAAKASWTFSKSPTPRRNRPALPACQRLRAHEPAFSFLICRCWPLPRLTPRIVRLPCYCSKPSLSSRLDQHDCPEGWAVRGKAGAIENMWTS